MNLPKRFIVNKNYNLNKEYERGFLNFGVTTLLELNRGEVFVFDTFYGPTFVYDRFPLGGFIQGNTDDFKKLLKAWIQEEIIIIY
jgi:hypothetical protein